MFAVRALITADQRPVHLLGERNQCHAPRRQIHRPDPVLTHLDRRLRHNFPAHDWNLATKLTKSC